MNNDSIQKNSLHFTESNNNWEISQANTTKS